MAFDQLSVVLAGLAILIAVGYTAQLTVKSDVGVDSLPWVGLKTGVFGGLRTRIGSLGTGVLAILEAGYRKYSASEISFIIPRFDKSMVILPGSQVKWIVDQADSVLSAPQAQRDSLLTDYVLLDPAMARNPIQEVIIRRHLTRSLGSLIEEIEEELAVGVTHYWGTDTDNWTDVGVCDTMAKVVARASNRIFVGPSLCRNDDYLGPAGSFANDVALSGTLLKLVPAIFQPLVAWIFVLPNRYHLYKASKYLIPFVKQRIQDLKDAERSGIPREDLNDYTTWHIQEVEMDAVENTPQKIALRIMTVNFAAIHTSTFTATNILFDIYSSPLADIYVKEIREEVEQALLESGGKWDKNTIAKLIKTDSAVRESLRISTFMTTGMDRVVVDPHGATMSNGLHLPQGTRLGTSTYSIHHDDSIYDNAMTYDAFRFSRPREAAIAAGKVRSEGEEKMQCSVKKEDLAKLLEAKNLATVTTSDTFLSFGHGRHACPGRFFAATEMKLLVAYIMMNYDVKPLAVRPPNTYIAGSIIPPMKDIVSVRRRKS
ncbi:cytochrome P450 [Hyaloscypha variabilis F]|uniref:Cytochrome P450 n=1 Tax=Hyaloscypha variabilis (strain UAMH 11265 / GT02V1 / F) TaxID=1149755 RepID=A0A2J6QVR3_HYAVF|nr:cytochrome P450 [Hyaloscypha variabilis F]